MFLKNHWYVAARSSELGRALLGRQILNEPVLLYRTEAGEAVAIEDRCCHRNVPLSIGKLVKDDVQCGYHGLVFNRRGSCISMPGQEKIPAAAKVKAAAMAAPVRYTRMTRLFVVPIFPVYPTG